MFPKIEYTEGGKKHYYQLNAHNQDNIYVGHSNTIIRPALH